MYIDMTSIDLLDQNVDYSMCWGQAQMNMYITGIDLFGHNVSLACAKVRLRNS